MAKVLVETTAVDKPNELSVDFDFVSATAADDIVVPFGGKDHATYFIVNATAACKLTVKAGNSFQGANDIDFDIKANKYNFFALDSGYFKNTIGANKGEVVLKSSGACKIAVIEARI